MRPLKERAVQDINAGLPLPQRRWAVLTIMLGIMLSVLDGTMIGVALPSLAREFQVSAASSVWIVNAYQLVIVMALLPCASLGEILGYRRVYCTGLLVFTLASALCALSGSLPVLIAARVLQGLGAACIMSVSAALVRFTYPPEVLGRGIGLNALVVALSAASGPSIAAVILYVADWPWMFMVNLPIGLAAFLLGIRVLPRVPGIRKPLDIPSALLQAAAFGLLIYAIDSLGHGSGIGLAALELVVALVAGALLIRRQLHRDRPLLPIDLLRVPLIGLSVATSTCSFTAQILGLLGLPFMLQLDLGFTPVETGLIMTAWPLSVGLVAPLAGRLADRYPVGLLSSLGLGILALGMTMLAALPQQPAVADILWRIILCGLGFGLFQAPNNRAIITSAPRARSGAAGGLLSTARLLGQSLGAALIALTFNWAADAAMRLPFILGAVFSFIALLVSSMRLRPSLRRPSPGS